MSETALTRTSRALDLVPFVVENPGISIGELASEFAISPKQILADLNMIFMCGLPRYTTLELLDIHFDDDFVSVVDPQVLDRPRALTKSESVALSLALSTLSQLRPEGDALRAEILELQQKLSSAIAQLDIKILPRIDQDAAESGYLREIEAAIEKGALLTIEYISAHSDRKSQRSIAPQRVRFVTSHIYLDAWDFDTSSQRTFRLDRITHLEIFESKNTPSSFSTVERSVTPSIRVELLITRKAQLLLEQNSELFSVLETSPSGIRVEANVGDLQWISRALLPFGNWVQVLAPLELASNLHDLAREALYLYK